jgi:hypothetical protein
VQMNSLTLKTLRFRLCVTLSSGHARNPIMNFPRTRSCCAYDNTTRFFPVTILISVNCTSIQFTTRNPHNGRAMAQVVSRRPLTAEARVRAQVNPCGICGGQSGTGTRFSLSSSVFPCQYYSSVALQTHIIWGMRNMLT